jgi:protein-disulfide isomerase
MMTQATWQARLTVPVSARDHVRGPATASVTLVEYGDYECPYCGMAHPIIEQVLAQAKDLVRFAYRHFPLSQMHPHAEHAAEVTEAAGAQGKFWAMHHTLLEHQRALDDAHLLLYAERIGLNLEQFTDELRHQVHAGRVREDFVSGVRSGVNGTPTFFINGVRHDGPFDYDALMAAIEGAAAGVTSP